jgi:hypothetical protein
MKKVLFSALIAVISLGITNIANGATGKPTTTTTTSPGSFSAGPFGCWGSGSCTTTVTTSGMIVNNGDGTVTVHWKVASLNAENQAYYDTREIFENPQPGGKIPDVECRALGLPIGTEFEVGAFPILKSGGELIITIPVI